MTTSLKIAFDSMSDLKLWYSDRAGQPLLISHVSEIIPLRWTYFRDNWEFIVDALKKKVDLYTYPDLLNKQIIKFDAFIKVQRSSQNTKINPFSNSSVLTDYYAIWDNIEISSIPLTRGESDIIDAKLNKIRQFIRTDFIDIKNDIIKARDDIADSIGLQDADYNHTYDRSSTRQLRSAKISDITDMQTLHDGLISVDYILANSDSLGTTTVDPFALAKINANNSDIDIRLNQSGRLVKMFYGDSLQSLAYRYLGSVDRWMDIAIANGLKPPYIDEVGIAIPLTVNGDGNQINIAKLHMDGSLNIDKIFINQVIFLQSNTIKFPDQRNILSIKEIPISGDIVIEVSGESNMGNYLTGDSAYIRVYKPNTINSNFMVMIPSEDPVDTPPGQVPYFLSSKAEDEKRAGVDFSLNDNLDLVFTSNGDLQLSYGLSNAIQAVQFKFMTEQGQVPRHPEYGMPSPIGTKPRDTEELKASMISGINRMIEDDSRFSRVENLSVDINNGIMTISVVVRMAGSGSLIPLSFNVNVG